MTSRWIWLVPSKICMVVDRATVSAARRPVAGPGISTLSTPVFRCLALAWPAGVVEDGPGAVPRGGDEMAVDLVRDLDALVPEPAGDCLTIPLVSPPRLKLLREPAAVPSRPSTSGVTV
jgi:hypothetical protein